MGSYKNNKDGTSAVISTNIQVVDAPMEQFVSRGEFNAVVPSDTSADNKLVNGDDVADYFEEHKSELTGNGIASIEKTATSGLVDTYTITFTNGNTTTFTVSNGLGIKSADINANGHLIITYSDDTTYDAGALSDIYATASDVDTKLNDVWKAQGRLGAKNLIPYPYYHGNNYLSNGINYHVEPDTSITINGTANNYSMYYLIRSNNFKAGEYILSLLENDIPASSGISLLAGIIKDNKWTDRCVLIINGKYSNSFTISQEDLSDNAMVGIRIAANSGTEVNSITIHPMLRLATDTDDTWQPYAPTNSELMQSDNALAEGLAKFGKKLWSGNFTSGSIQVTGAAKYTVFIMLLGSFNTVAIGNSGNGGGVVYAQKPNQEFTFGYVAYRLSSAVSGDDIIFTIDATHQGGMRDGVTYGDAADVHMPITAIYGLF